MASKTNAVATWQADEGKIHTAQAQSVKSRTVPRPQESGGGGVQSSGTNTPAPFAPSILLCCTVGASLQMLHVVGSLQLLLVQSSQRCGTSSNEKKSDARSAATSNALRFR